MNAYAYIHVHYERVHIYNGGCILIPTKYTKIYIYNAKEDYYNMTKMLNVPLLIKVKTWNQTDKSYVAQ